MNNINLISAEVVADSLNQYGERLTTFKLVFPRYILAELNTHRLFSKNSASSRAIPFKKMVKQVMETPFIPMAWQKNHPGMQGTEYLDRTDKYNLVSFMLVLNDTLNNLDKDSKEYEKLKKEHDEKLEIIKTILLPYAQIVKTLDEWWLFARDKAVETASILYVFGVTKQLCNRLLEPFLYHTVLLTATEYDNFFKLRCSKYKLPKDCYTVFGGDFYEKEFKSIKNMNESINSYINNPSKAKQIIKDFNLLSDLGRLRINKGQADIHIMDLAEKMWDVMNDSIPKQLKIGEWHIPFGDDIDEVVLFDVLLNLPIPEGEIIDPIFDYTINEAMLKIATARCARISYQTLGDNPVIDYAKDIKLFDDLLTSGHMSPFEHCAVVMDEDDYFSHVKGVQYSDIIDQDLYGWSRNFKGFKQYRELLDDKY